MVPAPGAGRRGAAVRTAMGGCLAACLLVAASGEAPAQDSGRGATLDGVAVAAGTGGAIAYARIRLEGTVSDTSFGTVTDSAGRFLLREVPPDDYELWIERFGQRSRVTDIRLDSAAVVEIRLTVTVPVLEVEDLSVTVDGRRPNGRLAGFERRRRRGHGYFLGPEEIRDMRAVQATDVLRRVPGLRVGVDGRSEVSIRTGRSFRECEPTVWINGQPLENYRFNNIPVSGLLAVEVFRGRSEIPSRFSLPQGEQCAAIVAWTRTGPRGPE